MGVLDGKVAFITGAARGQGRSHAIRLAQEGADIIAVDICAQLDRRIQASIADVRDLARLTEVVEEGVAELGRLDIVLANAGIWAVSEEEPVGPQARAKKWQETIDVNLTGAWNTVEAALPSLIAGGRGGSIVLTSSTAALKSMSLNEVSQTAYTAAKHGVIGVMRNYAVELAKYSIRVNTVAPTGVATPMVINPVAEKYLEKHPELGDLMANLLPVPTVDPVDISNAILFLVSDAGRYVTGITIPVDAGFLVK
jgi:NAD(P)-dependent dehydrogenase (short-subunit alcohol dehydrogenase family)